ncbi:hypothetical protein HII31_10911 [Pseudocercospora fuligena]|uniref:Heterokaryon incompatibility domain-containing protein n=1 Tax=Pseudocercospora fuligena TaxID=685502 RepID=A0A8H6VI96_9PEZI|nr:hypothetical protein HII31_10911 [Pseudocercospora fuligena]
MAARTSELPWLQDAGKQIRLLKRRNPTDGDTLAFHISVWDMDNLPEYRAISYTWGLPPDAASIFLSGQTFSIRPNCHYALWQAGLHFPDTYIWTDSICIDQTNVEEKNQQVQMMGSIYSNATGVLACVGPHADDSEQLYQRAIKYEAASYRSEHRVRDWHIIRSFGRRPYFFRLWIVQELRLAEQITILCGEHRLNLRDLSLAPQHEHWDLYMHFGSSLLVVREKNNPGKWTFWATLMRYSAFHCSEVRDHIYAMLSFAYINDQPACNVIKVDYSISLPSLALKTLKHWESLTTIGSAVSLLRGLQLYSGPGLAEILAFRNTLHRNASNLKTLDEQVLKASRDRQPVSKGELLSGEPSSSKYRMATFYADSSGRLALQTHTSSVGEVTSDIFDCTGKSDFRSGAGVQQVYVNSIVDDSVCKMIARVGPQVRPGDMLAFDLESFIAYHQREPQSLTSPEMTHSLLLEHYNTTTSELGYILRWIGPRFWKVIGHAHLNACDQQDRNESDYVAHLGSPQDQSGHDMKVVPYMSPEAAFLQLTHFLEVMNTPDERRATQMDEIVSRSPLSAYFYFR